MMFLLNFYQIIQENKIYMPSVNTLGSFIVEKHNKVLRKTRTLSSIVFREVLI